MPQPGTTTGWSHAASWSRQQLLAPLQPLEMGLWPLALPWEVCPQPQEEARTGALVVSGSYPWAMSALPQRHGPQPWLDFAAVP